MMPENIEHGSAPVLIYLVSALILVYCSSVSPIHRAHDMMSLAGAIGMPYNAIGIWYIVSTIPALPIFSNL